MIGEGAEGIEIMVVVDDDNDDDKVEAVGVVEEEEIGVEGDEERVLFDVVEEEMREGAN